LFDGEINVAASESLPINQIYPKPGWVEHDALEILDSQIRCIKRVLAASNIRAKEITCIGIANQRETVLIWDRHTGKPVHNAIVWQCRRASGICDALREKGFEKTIQAKTGLLPDAYFSGTKIKWLLDNVDGLRARAERGDVLAGTIDAWLIWNLTGRKKHVTDVSNASRTMLYNINSLCWDEELLGLLGIPKNILPEVVKSSGVLGYSDKSFFDAEIPISGVAGDQQAALFGQACFSPGMVKNTYGTGCFILMNTGKDQIISRNRLLTTIAWDVGEGVEYALEGSVFNAGSAIQWLRDSLRIIDSAPQADIEAALVKDTDGVYVVPAYTGLGAPYWDQYARGLIIGITRGTKREHIIRATLEAIAYQSMDVFMAMKDDSGIEIKEIRVDGGASVSQFLMQFQADLINASINRPTVLETTALGAAFLAGLGVGVWKDKSEIEKTRASEKVFTPRIGAERREELRIGWEKAVERSRSWA
jgi:glycerol kinase